jgi:hypothetical protein
MKPRHTAACARCRNVGKLRWIDDLLRFRMNKIGVFLCDSCYTALMQADARAWEWFREYRDRGLPEKRTGQRIGTPARSLTGKGE